MCQDSVLKWVEQYLLELIPARGTTSPMIAPVGLRGQRQMSTYSKRFEPQIRITLITAAMSDTKSGCGLGL